MLILRLSAKKTTAREVQLTEKVIQTIKAYQNELSASDDAVIFRPGTSSNPTNKYCMYLRRFYNKYGLDVKSHNFRTT